MNLRPPPRGLSRAALAVVAVVAVLAAASLLFGCARSKSWIERRRDTFLQIAVLINEPIRGLQPYHVRIVPSSRSITLVDTQLDACFEAAPRIEAIERAPLPPDDQGKPIESAAALTRATESFRTGLSACKARRASGASGATGATGEMTPAERAESVSQCLLRCMQDWSQIVRSVEHVRRDADWVGVRVESIAFIKIEETAK
ncbi:MAG TPA: hypothetical protein VK459_13725 [Polyangiaceae bacterium]|nr:hypothetical protein [Polyangiaceae bacterium]